MCLTAEALALFLNMITVPDLTMEPGRIIVHTQTHDAHWVAVDDNWCTKAPQRDQDERFATVRGE